jgi:hypothetical protein
MVGEHYQYPAMMKFVWEIVAVVLENNSNFPANRRAMQRVLASYDPKHRPGLYD